jgi:CRISPR-associated protein Cmr6
MGEWVNNNSDSNITNQSNWREAFYQNNVQVWARFATDESDCHGIKFFHCNYKTGKSIYKSSLTGTLTQIGRIWHRMYPVQPSDKGNKNKYVEILTIFPNREKLTQDFLDYLEKESNFKKIW